MRLPLTLLVLAAASGCHSDQLLGKAGDYAGTDGPLIAVDPSTLDFGSLAAGEIVTRTFEVSNIGTEGSTLHVSDIRLAGPAGGYTITDGPTTFELTPEDEPVAITVAFTPVGANEQLSEAVVDSDDPTAEHVSVLLRGEGRVPELQIDPDPLDMGETFVGCAKDNVITLTNIGTDVLAVSDLTHAGPSDVYTFTNPNAMPLVLDPGASAEVYLTFTPTIEGDFPTTLTATSNEPLGTRTASETGRGAYAASYVDEWEVSADPPVDLLFFVDQSGSMDDDQANLADNFAAFISQLSSFTSDWQIMVVNDDDGCNNSGILVESTPNYASQFERAVSLGGGTWTEAGLTVSSAGVDNTDSGECNDGFLREGALLHIVLVSDEPEQSRPTWDTLVDRIIAKKGDSSLVKISAVAGDYPSGCTSRGNSAEYGSGYYEAANATGGEFLSICSDWSENVEALANASVTRTTFALAHTPVETTLVVYVNDAVATGWHYDAGSNSVVFDTNVPVEGDHVRAEYGASATCD